VVGHDEHRAWPQRVEIDMRVGRPNAVFERLGAGRADARLQEPPAHVVGARLVLDHEYAHH
jgi:hypothetical protein